MDQQDIYMNVKRPRGNPGKRKNLVKGFKSVYENEDRIQTLELNRTGPADTKGVSEWVQLQSSYNNLSAERDQLQKRFEAITKDKNDLPTKLLSDTEKNRCDRWVKLGSSCYYVSTEQKTWTESRKECQSKGADLVIINSEEEQKFVIKFNKRIWIGLTDQDEEGIWKWVDGTALTAKYWYAPQPDDGGQPGVKEDCAEMYVKGSDPLLKWNDIPCSHRNYWVCEI
ncbi:asialoglycoprotein receptor 2-like isoform X2 [Epinephelus moara]|uniref:asialoglycoprotein receptor 2-like isoform X2 n=1 Tax=Epinephelus moara TaxID=300413 RepID=UPI00214ECC1A|nr:asialoglycoprotein receptor 2-like isoform X2 [Epinephelus moara]